MRKVMFRKIDKRISRIELFQHIPLDHTFILIKFIKVNFMIIWVIYSPQNEEE